MKNGLKTFRILFVAVLLALISVQAQMTETKQQHDQRMALWREAKFGLFILGALIRCLPEPTMANKSLASASGS